MWFRSLNLITNTETPAACGSDDPTAACEHQSDNYVSSSAWEDFSIAFDSRYQECWYFIVLCDTNLITFLPNFIIRDNIPIGK